MRKFPIDPNLLLIVNVLAIVCWPWAAAAQDLDWTENILGATNVHAVAGSGGLTLGVSRDGDVTVLTWPSPSYSDQLSYLTVNSDDARQLPRFGASEGMGAFAGVVTSRDGGTTLDVSWIRDEGWTRTIRYLDQRSSVIVVTATSAELGLEVVQTDVVDEVRDVWVRHLVVTRTASSSVTDAWALFYLNLSPAIGRLPQIPLADWAMEPRNDFAALFDERRGVIVHFHPGDTGVLTSIADLLVPAIKDYGPIGALLEPETPPDAEAIAALTDALDDEYEPGVYLTIGSTPRPDAWQVGFDESDLCGPIDTLIDNIVSLPETNPELASLAGFADLLRCPEGEHPGQVIRDREGWLVEADDALSDASDGTLSGSSLAAGHVNEAIRVPLELVEDGGEARASATLYLAAADTAAGSAAAYDEVRAMPPEDLIESTADAHRAWLAPLALPEAPELEPRVTDFAARALLNLRVGTDRRTKAIVASISRQPPYGEDWPRDGAFFNAALDVAGLSDVVTERVRLYASWQRDAEVAPIALIEAPGPGFPDDPDNTNYPADAWEMNYYADGMIGGSIRWEIDNTALLVWSFVYHAGYIEDDGARRAYLEEVYPSISRAADLLTMWRDPSTYLPWLANEDDNMVFTQGLQGAGTTFGALRAAAMAARALGNIEDAERWELRAAEVRWAIEHSLYEEGVGFIENVTENPGSAGTGSSSWLAWPEHVFGPDDDRMITQLEANLDEVLARLEYDSPGGAYLTKTALAVALVHPDEEIRQRALQVALRLIDRVADPDTLFLGEVFVAVDEDGDGLAERFDNRVATPHLWAATLVYLTLMAAEQPELFDRYESLLPAAEIPDDVEPPPVTGDAGPDGGADGGDASIDEAGPPMTAVGGQCECTYAGARPGPRWSMLLVP